MSLTLRPKYCTSSFEIEEEQNRQLASNYSINHCQTKAGYSVPWNNCNYKFNDYIIVQM